jgi:hypothetical protein
MNEGGEWFRNQEPIVFLETSWRFQTSRLEDAGFALGKLFIIGVYPRAACGFVERNAVIVIIQWEV